MISSLPDARSSVVLPAIYILLYYQVIRQDTQIISSSGEYEIFIKVRTPGDEEISAKTTLFAEELNKADLDHYVDLNQ